MAVEFPLIHPRFTSQQLALVAAGRFQGYALKLNGAAVAKVNGSYTVLDDSGRPVALKIKLSAFDPVPQLRIDDEVVRLVRPLTWYEYIWLGFPMAVLMVGGPMFIVAGYPVAVLNSRILRSNRAAFERYALTGLVSIGIVGLVLLSAIAFGLILSAIASQ